MNKTILITGGSGLIGKALTRKLLQKGFTVHHLSRDPQDHGNPKLKIFKWDVLKNEIDEDCLQGVESIIHLAGEGIVDKRWTAKRKEEIIKSRTNSIAMLYNLISKTTNHKIQSVISSSAIGYYGDRENQLLNENSKSGEGFLPISCIAWEKAVDEGLKLNLRVVKLRTGIVLSAEGGALPEIAKLIKKGLGSPLGSGNQWMSWVHIQDAVNMYVFALENENTAGVYNMTSPQPVTNTEMTSTLAAIFDKKVWLPNVPAIGLKLMMGEMSAVVLDSSRVSSEKIINKGFQFKFPTLENALKEIYLN